MNKEDLITIHEALEKSLPAGSPPSVYSIYVPDGPGWAPSGAFAVLIPDWGFLSHGSSCGLFMTRNGLTGGFARGSMLDKGEAKLMLQPTTHLEVAITLKKD